MHIVEKSKYRGDILRKARIKGLHTSFLIAMRYKMVETNGEFYLSNYVPLIQQALGKTTRGVDLTHSFIAGSFKRLLKDGFVRQIIKDNKVIGYRLISYIDMWILIEGLHPTDKRFTRDNLAKLQKENINQLEDSIVLFFKTIPSKQELEAYLYGVDLSSWIAKTALKNQTIDQETMNAITVFQQDNTGGAIASLSRLCKTIFGYKGVASTYKMIQSLIKRKTIRKKSRLVAYTSEEIEYLWQEYCFFKYQKFSSAEDWLQDLKPLVDKCSQERFETVGGNVSVDRANTSFEDYLKINERKVVSKGTLSSTDPTPRIVMIHNTLQKTIDGEELTSEEQEFYEEWNERNSFTGPSFGKAVFLDEQEFEEFLKTKTAGIFPSDFLKLRCNARDLRGTKRVVFIDKVPYRVLANEYSLHEDSSCKIMKGFTQDSTGNRTPHFHLPFNVQKSSLLVISESQAKSLQSCTEVIVIM